MYKLPKHIIVQKQQQVVQKAQAFGHILIYSEYESNLAALPKLPKTKQEHFRFRSVRKAVLFLRCPHHKN